MNKMSTSLVSFTEYRFRLTDHGGNRWIVNIEFKLLATEASPALQIASKFVRDYQLVPKNFTLCWRIDRHRPNSFIYIGEPK
jgi:hypothetical protein